LVPDSDGFSGHCGVESSTKANYRGLNTLQDDTRATAGHNPAPEKARIAVVIPCRDEAAAIAKVVQDFKKELPSALIYVYDNNSTDDTKTVAAQAGAVVRYESLPGKGNVVRRMFSDIEADVYILVDGDDTYDASGVRPMIDRLENECLDMVVGARVASSESAYRPRHRFGNLILNRLVAFLFGNRVSDMLSGYRVFSRRFIKSFPALSAGFEIETELTIHALELRMPIEEMAFPYRGRPADSESKLNTYRDGWRILKTIIKLAKEEKPLLVFGVLALFFALTSVVLAWPLFVTFVDTGLVPRFPTAILATGLMLLAFLMLACGAILDTVTLGRRELRRLHYLSVPRHRGRRFERDTDANRLSSAALPE
jgi:glycosyltransferase involved in cell wall biosynthesis